MFEGKRGICPCVRGETKKDCEWRFSQIILYLDKMGSGLVAMNCREQFSEAGGSGCLFF